MIGLILGVAGAAGVVLFFGIIELVSWIKERRGP